MSADISELWGEALKKYSSATGTDLASFAANIATVDDITTSAEEASSKFKEWRNDGGKVSQLRSAISGVLGPVDVLGNAVSGAASNVFQPASTIFSAVSLLIKASSKVSANYDNILVFFEDIKAFLSRLNVLAVSGSIAKSQELRQCVVEILSSVLVICGLSERAMKQGRFVRFTKNIIKEDDELQKAYERLSKAVDREGRIVNTQTLAIVTRVDSGLRTGFGTSQRELQSATRRLGSKMDASFDELNKKIDSLSKAQSQQAQQEKLSAVMDFFKTDGSAEDDLAAIRRKLMPDTADWLFQEPTMKSWLGASNAPIGMSATKNDRILWLSAGPGCGKTFMAGAVIQRLQAMAEKEKARLPAQTTKPINVGYCFFHQFGKTGDCFSQALRTVITQIAQANELYCARVAGVIRSFQSASSLSVETLLREFIVGPLRKLSSAVIHIVLDGMDETEAEKRHEFLEALSEADGDDTQLRVLLIGRPELDMEVRSLNGTVDTLLPIIRIGIKSEGDIERYIDTRYSKSGLSKGNQQLRTKVVEELNRGADGMFLWVDLMLKELSSKKSTKQVLAALENLPRGLNAMYDRFFQGLHAADDEAAGIVRSILAWVIVSPGQTIFLRVLQSFLCLELEDEILDLEGILEQYCSSLVVVTLSETVSLEELRENEERTILRSTSDAVHSTSVQGDGEDGQDDSALSASPHGVSWEKIDPNLEIPKTSPRLKLRHASVADYLRSPRLGTSKAVFCLWDAKKFVAFQYLKALHTMDNVYTEGTAEFALTSDFNQHFYRNWHEALWNINPELAGASIETFEVKKVLEELHWLYSDKPYHLGYPLSANFFSPWARYARSHNLEFSDPTLKSFVDLVLDNSLGFFEQLVDANWSHLAQHIHEKKYSAEEKDTVLFHRKIHTLFAAYKCMEEIKSCSTKAAEATVDDDILNLDTILQIFERYGETQNPDAYLMIARGLFAFLSEDKALRVSRLIIRLLRKAYPLCKLEEQRVICMLSVMGAYTWQHNVVTSEPREDTRQCRSALAQLAASHEASKAMELAKNDANVRPRLEKVQHVYDGTIARGMAGALQTIWVWKASARYRWQASQLNQEVGDLFMYLVCLFRGCAYAELVRLAKTMSEELLYYALDALDAQDFLAFILSADKCGELDWMESRLKAVMHRKEDTGRSSFYRSYLALLYVCFRHDQETAWALWNTCLFDDTVFMKLSSGRDSSSTFSTNPQKQAIQGFSAIALDHLQHAAAFQGKASFGTDQELIALLDKMQEYQDAIDIHSSTNFRTIRARAHRTIGDVPTAMGLENEVFHSLMELLSDDVGWNDSESFERLGRLFLSIGWEEDARISLSVIFSDVFGYSGSAKENLDPISGSAQQSQFELGNDFLLYDEDGRLSKELLEKRSPGYYKDEEDADSPICESKLVEKAFSILNEIYEERIPNLPLSNQDESVFELTSQQKMYKNSQWNQKILPPMFHDEDLRPGIVLPMCKQCNSEFAYFSIKLYFCEVCPMWRFCEYCYTERKAASEKNQNVGICYFSPRHNFVELPMDGWQGVKDGVIRMDKGNIHVNDWLSDLKKRWRERKP